MNWIKLTRDATHQSVYVNMERCFIVLAVTCVDGSHSHTELANDDGTTGIRMMVKETPEQIFEAMGKSSISVYEQLPGNVAGASIWTQKPGAPG